MTSHAYALVGRTFPSDEFALLFQASETARARRRALMRSADARALRSSNRHGRRWRVGREPVTMAARLSR